MAEHSPAFSGKPRLANQIKVRGDAPDADSPLPAIWIWAELANFSEQLLSGRVALEASARLEARSAQFESPQEAACGL